MKFPEWLVDRTSNPVFWLMWVLLFPIFSFLLTLAHIGIEKGWVFYLLIFSVPTVLALVGIYLVERSGSIANLIFGMHRKDQLQADRDFIESNSFNKGMAAERDEKYTEAVVLLNEVLEVNPKHIEARFRLARIYHRQLKRKGSAIHEYENLMEILPKGAPYHMTAREAAEELLGKRAVPEPIKPLEWKT